MSHVTVKQLADVVGAPVDRLLEQIKQAGLQAENAESPISDEDKMKLLDFLRSSHGKAQADVAPVAYQVASGGIGDQAQQAGTGKCEELPCRS